MIEVQITQMLAELAAQLNVTQVVTFIVMVVVVGVFTLMYRSSQQTSEIIANNNALLKQSLDSNSTSDTSWATIVTAVNTNGINSTKMITDAMDRQTTVMDRMSNAVAGLEKQLAVMDARITGNTAAIDDIAQMMVDGQGSVERALQAGFEGVTADLRTLQTLTKEYEAAAKQRHASVEAQVGAHDEQYAALTEQLSRMVQQIFELSDTVTRILRDNKLHEQGNEPIDPIDDDTQTGVPNNGS